MQTHTGILISEFLNCGARNIYYDIRGGEGAAGVDVIKVQIRCSSAVSFFGYKYLA